MNTVVVQSFRSTDVPRYITRCCESVRTWAESAGYAYQFFDDGFLELAPEWYRRKAGACICVVADVARLVLARRLLTAGFDQVVWCDADLLIFCPERMAVEPHWTGTYCKEVWLHSDTSGRLVPEYKVNNSMCVFAAADLCHLDEYIAQCHSVVQSATDAVGSLVVGTNVLTAQYASRALIWTVGMVSPHLMVAILDEDEAAMAQFRTWQGSPIYAANLCNTQRTMFGQFPHLFDHLCDGVVERLRSGTAGQLLSQSV